jgi:phosphopantetheine--protein transferase-like protein
MTGVAGAAGRCGIDTVEIARVERLLRETPAADLAKLFSAEELRDAGEGPGRAASLAARFAAKEACLKLFPRETALGKLAQADFAVARDNYGAPRVVCSPAALDVLARNRVTAIALSLTHDRTSASAVALAEPSRAEPSFTGKLLYRLLPIRRRVILGNLRRVYGDTVPDEEITRLAQAHYGHLGRLALEFLWFPWISAARRAAMVRVENLQALESALAQGKGVLVLTGHFGNFEVATAAGLDSYPHARGRFWFVRRPIKPAWLDAVLTRRSRRAGFGVLPKRGGLEAILDRLNAGDLVVFPFDQHAGRKDGVVVDFFGHPAGTFRSLAILALNTGAPVVPAASWREANGHVLRFEAPLGVIESDDVNEAIRRNTRAYNAALERLILRHPEQWWWVHRRWKAAAGGTEAARIVRSPGEGT